ncbi:non-ribosomal peptide synthetase [Iningainema tapete]|uniref:Amino acid adenylation domain-containing protein n=1 Tax=Iningainema tapete BLCC-T55 TaxID=2748662 RepID=A0A8J6XMR9_9CYAN|nr:non-ribosomal peptide synthetase [Iningainema tapete]MBD2775781.1 amino acid adenylation domain-containing protein [Iningainema tapete BLCC-T55]
MSDLSKQIAALSPEQRALFEMRLKQRNLSPLKTLEISRRKDSEDLPLSFAQQRLWFIQQLYPNNSTYNVSSALHLLGQLNVALLEQVFTEIVKRHETLRTTFTNTAQGQPIQVIAPIQSVTLSIVDLKEVFETEKEVQRLVTEEAYRPFDLTEPLLRLTLLQLGETEYVLLLTTHHIICDRWSLGVFFREIKVLYEAFASGKPSPLTELSIQYADWTIWQRQWLQGKTLEAQLTYWKQQLESLTVLELPTDRPRPAFPTYRGTTLPFVLPKTLSDALKALSAKEGVTLFTLLLAAFQVLLHRYTNQDDIVVGTDIANRNRVETEGLIGFLINTLVLRTNLSSDLTFRELLNQVRSVTLGAYAHQDVPFEKLVEVLNPKRNISQMMPLFQVKFDFQQAQVEPLELSGLTVSPLPFTLKATRFELRFNLWDTEPGLAGQVEYSTDLFDAATITRMVAHYQTLLEAIVTNTQQQLWELPLLTDAEQYQLLHEWNDTQVEYPQSQCIYQLFESQVEHTPDAVAVVFEDQQLTYRELNARANQLAHYLRSLGVGPEVLVGICVERSPEMLIGLLGILKAGGAYVPLDPAYPQERLAFMLADAQIPVLLTQEKLVSTLPEHQAQIVCLDTDWMEIAQLSTFNPTNTVTTENLAYVIYTSGSTGQPKGVQIPHSAVVNFLSTMRQTPGLTQEDILLSVTTLSFDIAALEIYLPLIVGARLLLVSREVATDGIQLLEHLTTSDATVMQATPATWRMLLAAGWQDKLPLKILCGGEALERSLANQLLSLGTEVWNLYGPTETTIWSAVQKIESHKELQPEAIVSIGHPIANTQFYILDSHQKLVPIGVRGELHIGGAGLARGYLHRPELTAQKFIPNPFDKESRSRLYKTGDLVRYRPEGTIEFLGRIDNQVKIRGFRIELGEIEALLCQHPGVQESVVVAAKDKSGSQLLVAYVVCQPEQVLTIAQLRHLLESKLPNYMVPKTFVMLEALPLTPNGKVDRRSLPVPDLTQLKPEFVAPSTPVEEMLAGIWAEVLGIEVGIYDNFFELGGHSLLATRVISQVRQIFAIELPLRQLFEKPTVAELASYIEIATQAGLRPEVPPIERISRDGEIPVSFAQQRLWFLTQLEPESPFYNIPGAVRLQGQLNIAAFSESLNEIMRRHEALRTNFKTVEGRPVAFISAVTQLRLPMIDLSELPFAQREAEVYREALAEAQQPFDLNSAPLLRVKLLRLGEQEYIALFTMHHIASDGWSIGVLVREVAALYQAFSTGQPSPLRELPIQYADFAAWQRQWLKTEVLESQLSYWRLQLDGAPAVLELPTDHPRPVVGTFRGSTYSFELSQQLSVALKTLSQQEKSTLFMTLLAAFKILLGGYTVREDIVVGSPIANRNYAEIEGLIGFFVNILVLRTQLSGNPTFRELLHRVREVALGAYAHQDLPFEQLVEQLQPQRSLSYTPLFQVMFVLQNAPMSVLELSGLTLSPVESHTSTAKFDLTLYIKETAGQLVATWEYNTDLFAAQTIHRMAGHFQILLEGIVANPDQHIWELPLLTKAERKTLLIEWNNTFAEYPQDTCIHQLFESFVERTPEAIAVVFGTDTITYRELNTKANQLAHYLRKQGVKPEVLVGICVERSLLMMIGLLGILKAGGAYVPLDPAYPQERLAFMLEDTQLPVLLTTAQLVNPEHQAQVVYLDTDWDSIALESQHNPINYTKDDNLAYVIYTSGSTGKPKGVCGLHRGAVNRFHWMWQKYPFTQGEVCCQKTSLNFVDSVWEIFGPLLQGIPTVIVPDRVVLDPQQFVATLAQHNVTRLVLVPSLLRMLLDTEDLQLRLPKLKLWVTSGEALSIDLLQKFRLVMPNSTLLNLYGSSEVSADVTCHSISFQEERNSVVIGRPIANTQVYVLNQHMQPVPIGIPGELHIGGAGLARGYLNRPNLTNERFIPNPFTDFELNGCLYKTGDRCRYLPNGDLEYLGRIDYQVKIRGFRIELGEIEAVLAQHPDVRESVVVAHSDESGSQLLVAYVVCQPEQVLTIAQLRHFLESKLPNYMMPAAFVLLETLPLTPNGKVDRKALPAPDTVRPELEAVYQPPQTEIEQAIANIWQELLHIEDVGIYDNFFELGGHSLLLVQIHSKLQKRFQRDFPLVEMFQYPTISHLAKYLSQESSEQESFTQHSDRSHCRTASVQRRKQARKEHRSTKQKGVS